jgi:hypothetical protein
MEWNVWTVACIMAVVVLVVVAVVSSRRVDRLRKHLHQLSRAVMLRQIVPFKAP